MLLLAMLTLCVFFYFKSQSPLLSSLILVMYAFTTGLIFLSNEISWLFYSLILMFLGGMMVVFVYATSLSLKNKNLFSLNWSVVSIVTIFLGSASLLTQSDMPCESQAVSLLFNSLSLNLLFLKAFFLLVCLLIVVKLVLGSEGPLKSN